MTELTDVLLSIEQRITNIENFINRYDFDCLPEIRIEECQHEPNLHGFLASDPPTFICIKCGEFYK